MSGANIEDCNTANIVLFLTNQIADKPDSSD